MKKLPEDKFPYCKAQIKFTDFSSRKENDRKPHIITKFIPFVKDSLAERQYLTSVNCECKDV